MIVKFSKSGAIVSTVIILAFFAATQIIHRRGHGPGDKNIDLSKLPREIGVWKATDAEPLSAKSHDILQLDQFVRRVYTDDKNNGVFVYIGYWTKQSGEHQAAKHSPLMCLPANGWKISSPESRLISLSGNAGSQDARQLVGVLKDDSVLFYYWFFSGEEIYVDETEALFHIMHETIVNARSDGGIVELSLNLNKEKSIDDSLKEGEAVLQNFVQAFSPALKQLIH